MNIGNIKPRLEGGYLLAGCGLSVSAATFTVTTKADSGTGSLRSAMTNANASPGPHPATSPSRPVDETAETIHLLSGLPNIAPPVTTDGDSQPGSNTNTLAAPAIPATRTLRRSRNEREQGDFQPKGLRKIALSI
jgi:hypothetical protein